MPTGIYDYFMFFGDTMREVAQNLNDRPAAAARDLAVSLSGGPRGAAGAGAATAAIAERVEAPSSRRREENQRQQTQAMLAEMRRLRSDVRRGAPVTNVDDLRGAFSAGARELALNDDLHDEIDRRMSGGFETDNEYLGDPE